QQAGSKADDGSGERDCAAPPATVRLPGGGRGEGGPMTAGITGIDHIIIGVADLDRAAAAYRRLGFTLSPRGLHSAAMGTANHTVMLERDYFELLAVLAPTALNASWRDALAEGEGVIGLAAATPGAAAARSAWLAAGLSPGEPVAFSRPVERPAGGTTEARFEILSLPSGSLPG